jgi:hypothetical protein
MSHLSGFDTILDKPWVDFENHIALIEQKEISLLESPLYKYLEPSIQNEIDIHHDVGIKIEIVKNKYFGKKTLSHFGN